MTEWTEIAAGVLVRRYTELDLTVGLVLGDDRALVVDTRGDLRQGDELRAAVREVTARAPEMVLTHGHFDHSFGAVAFRPAPLWAHPGCTRYLRDHAERQRAEWAAHYRAEQPETADALLRTQVVLPDRETTGAELDLGGRVVELRHFGPAHTDHDLAVLVPDAGAVFAGDLVEHGADPDFEDAVPEGWPAALDGLLRTGPEVVVPGHGDPVGVEFVQAQRADLALLADVVAAVRRGDLSASDAEAESPFTAGTTARALRSVH